MKLLTIVGGISKNSLNKKLFEAVKTLAPSNVEITTFDIARLPFFSQDLEANPPESVRDLRQAISDADALLFITPEYNRSFPAVLKNALDWGSRPYGQNKWAHKPAGVMGASVGNIGTFGAQHHLRQVLSYLEVAAMGQPEFYLNGSKAFDEAGTLSDPKVKELIANYWSALEKWIALFKR